ncbi:MAG: aldo/keto reductase [Chloroflexi bacterium]|nr:aldo/keto reductase [Chloroflexota bacterium]
MNLRSLGSSKYLVSPIGVGLAALGRPSYINLGHADDLERDYNVASMEARTHKILDTAYQQGVRYFDVARSYGRAEEFLGHWLRTRNIPLGAVVVGSKWGYIYTADWQFDANIHEVKDHSLTNLQKQWSESYKNLGAYLNLYQIHSATIESGVLKNRAVLTKLALLKERNVVIGLTSSGSRQKAVIELATNFVIDGVQLFDCMQATWNLLETSAGKALQTAREAGIGIIIKEALANGRLTERNTETAFAGNLTLLRKVAKRLGTTVDALALASVHAQPWVDVVLSGATKVEHLLSHLKAQDVPWDDETAFLLKGLVEMPDEYWKTRSKMLWN